MVTFRAAAFGFVMLLVFACASNRAVIFVAPSNETVVSGTEMALSGEGQVVFVYNHSSVSIVVTGLHLIDCENIKNRCEVQHIRIPYQPANERISLQYDPTLSAGHTLSGLHTLGNRHASSRCSRCA